MDFPALAAFLKNAICASQQQRKKKHRETNAQYAPLPALSSSSGNWETFAVMHKAWYRIVLLIYILPSLPGPSESEVRMYVQSEAVCACV